MAKWAGSDRRQVPGSRSYCSGWPLSLERLVILF